MSHKKLRVLVLSRPRSGGRLLMSLISESWSLCDFGECFSIVRPHPEKNEKIIRKIIANDPDAKQYYKKFLLIREKNKQNNSQKESEPGIQNILDDMHIQYMFDYTDKFEAYKGNIFKMFLEHMDGRHNKIDINKIFDKIDILFLLERKNSLLSWISFEKAILTKCWWINKKMGTEILQNNRNFKIKWEKEKYLNYLDKRQKDFESLKYFYNQFEGKKKHIYYEDYENSAERPFTQYMKSLSLELGVEFQECNQKHKPLRQSDPSIAIEDRFVNKEDFLRDYAALKNQHFETKESDLTSRY